MCNPGTTCRGKAASIILAGLLLAAGLAGGAQAAQRVAVFHVGLRIVGHIRPPGPRLAPAAFVRPAARPATAKAAQNPPESRPPAASEPSPLAQKQITDRIEGADSLIIRTLIVRRGDTLRAIAARFYGDAERFGYVYLLNREVIPSPGALIPGMRLSLPLP